MKQEKNAPTSKPEDAPGLDRRAFIKRVAIDSSLAAGLVAGGFALKGKGLPLEEEAIAPAENLGRPGTDTGPGQESAGGENARPAVLAVAKHVEPGMCARQAIDALGGMKTFIASGDRVLIKPNIGWDRRPKFAANTDPEVVASLARMCLEAGAGEVVVTDSPCNNPTRCFDKSGIKKALASLDVKVLVPTDRDYVERNLGGQVLKTWPVMKALLDCDKVINVPIAKHHSSAILSLGMKNWYGILGGGKKRGQLHQAMALSIAELAEFVRPHLTVLDAMRILFRNGPQGGSTRDTKVLNTVVASIDPVAVDAYGARFFDLRPEEVPYIPIAVEKKLGSADLAALEIREVGG